MKRLVSKSTCKSCHHFNTSSFMHVEENADHRPQSGSKTVLLQASDQQGRFSDFFSLAQPWQASKTPSCSPNLFGDLEPQHDLQISVLFCLRLKQEMGNLLPPRTVFSDMSMSLDPQSATKTGSLIYQTWQVSIVLVNMQWKWKQIYESRQDCQEHRNKDRAYPEITNEAAAHKVILPYKQDSHP